MQAMKFLDEIPIDIEHTLEQLLGRFQTVSDGLPELVKNSKDQYARLGLSDRAKRPVVVLVNTKSKTIAVLDFAGANHDRFKRWVKWSDKKANEASIASDIEGGHGNGGKAFMVRGSTTFSFMESCVDGRRTKMGFENESVANRFKPAFFTEGGKPIDNSLAPDPRACLDQVLKSLRCKYEQLPASARAMFEERNSFTVVQVEGVREWVGRREDTQRRLINNITIVLETHGQAALTVETCAVWLVVDGKLAEEEPVSFNYPDPFPGFEKPIAVDVPDSLVDPVTKEAVNTRTEGVAAGKLMLHTSQKSLRLEETRPLNVVRVRNERNIVGNWSVADLYARAESAYIYGQLKVSALTTEHTVGADRSTLADTSLVRALRHWTALQVQELAEKLQRATAREHKSEDRDKANEGLRKMRDLMREFLEGASPGTEGGGKGSLGEGNGGVVRPPKDKPQYGARVDELVLEAGARSIALAAGTSVPIVVRAFENRDDGTSLPVKVHGLHFNCTSRGLVSYTDGDGTLEGLRAGDCDITFETPDGRAKSNTVSVNVVECVGAEIRDIPERQLLQGERLSLRMVLQTSDGPRTDLLLDASIDEQNMGRINRHGVFTAGSRPGTATSRLKYGGSPDQTVSAQVQIGTEKVPYRGKGSQEGGEVPLILLCGTSAPGMENYPPEHRTIAAAEHLPTIIDYEPQFEHVIFLNPDSKEAIQVRRGKGGRKGVAGIGTETFIQFLALKCFEILKRLYVRASAKEGAITEQQFRDLFAEAEMECAPFIDRAYEAAHALTAGAYGQ